MVQTPTIYNIHQQNEIVDYVLKINNYNNIENYISNVLMIEDNIENQVIKIAKNKNRSMSYYGRLIQKYNLGLTVPPSDIIAFKDAIIRILDSPYEFKPKTDKFVDNFSLPTVIKYYNQIFEGVSN